MYPRVEEKMTRQMNERVNEWEIDIPWSVRIDPVLQLKITFRSYLDGTETLQRKHSHSHIGHA